MNLKDGKGCTDDGRKNTINNKLLEIFILI